MSDKVRAAIEKREKRLAAAKKQHKAKKAAEARADARLG